MTEDEILEEELTGKASSSPSSSNKINLLSEPSSTYIPLPSKSILYKKDPSMSDIHDGKICVRPMTLRELELFLKPDLIETGSLIDAVFKNCIKSNINPLQLLTSDRTFILMWIRAESFGKDYRFSFKCSECKKKISTQVDVSDLPVYTLDEIHAEKDKDGNIKKDSIKDIKEPFKIKLPRSGAIVYFRLSRGIDESTIATDNYFERTKKELKNRGIERKSDGTTVIKNITKDEFQDETFIDEFNSPTIYDQLSKVITKIEGVPDDRIGECLNNLTAGDITYLQESIVKCDSGMDLDLVIECPNPQCKNENAFTMPLTETFFRSSL